MLEAQYYSERPDLVLAVKRDNTINNLTGKYWFTVKAGYLSGIRVTFTARALESGAHYHMHSHTHAHTQAQPLQANDSINIVKCSLPLQYVVQCARAEPGTSLVSSYSSTLEKGRKGQESYH